MNRYSSGLGIVLGIVFSVVTVSLRAQTTAGIGTTIVFPVTAQTTSFASEVTLFNPGPNPLTASVKFYEGNNSATPGLKTCSDVTLAAARSAQIKLSTQCTLTAASHFGLLVVADKASPQSHNFYGYMRVQNPQGIGFSVEGFPVEDFSNQVADTIGLMRQAASPGYQTNCFVGSLDQPVSYSVKLFNGFSGSQIGSTVTGSLTAFQQIRYLDIFGSNGVNAPVGDHFNVRAEFTQTSGGTANLIGFCTVQDNTSFGADFRVAKSYGSPSGSFFAQGGNAFGTAATLGTTDNQPLNVIVNGGRVMHYEQNATSPNIIGGFVNNGIYPAVVGTSIGGGGAASNLYAGITCPYAFGCQNSVTDHFGTIGGGIGNLVGDTDSDVTNSPYGTVGGGFGNAAGNGAFVGGGAFNQSTGGGSSISGGSDNTASGLLSSIPGGFKNHAGGEASFAAGWHAHADFDGCFVWSDHSNDTGASCTTSDQFWVQSYGGVVISTASGIAAVLAPGSGAWSAASDRAGKDNVTPINAQDILRKVASMPIATWNWKSQDVATRHMGPMAQDFHQAFGLGESSKAINTVDADGVALAAIQGLHQLLLKKDEQITALQAETILLRGETALLKQRMLQVEGLADLIASLRSANLQTSGDAARVAVAP